MEGTLDPIVGRSHLNHGFDISDPYYFPVSYRHHEVSPSIGLVINGKFQISMLAIVGFTAPCLRASNKLCKLGYMHTDLRPELDNNWICKGFPIDGTCLAELG